ncbi:unnamed protein product [Toxocara canis]|uniref:Uncharacterized protein n=1 Tax=Toxocara canis TaxID=6265 RepID=A0A183U3L1_TOXCA|nr:unnamed protein product [Toxocara canis]
MKNTSCPQLTMKLGNENIEHVEHYPYLGQIVQMNNDLGLELSKRRRAACTAFTTLKDIFCDTKIRPSVKAELSIPPFSLFYCMGMEHGTPRSLKKTN